MSSNRHSARILTLFLTRDNQTFNEACFNAVLHQPVNQTVVVLSSSPILTVEKQASNFVFPVSKSLPLPIRIGITINVFLKRIGVPLSRLGFSHIFKVDGDNCLPSDYLPDLLSKNTPVAGAGAAMLIEMQFFINIMKGKYPVNYCDDGFIFALCQACGVYPMPYSGSMSFIPDYSHSKFRNFCYGYEFFKWGESPASLFFRFISHIIFQLRHRKNLLDGLQLGVFEIAGYIHASFSKPSKYFFHRHYRLFRDRYAAKRLAKWLLRLSL